MSNTSFSNAVNFDTATGCVTVQTRQPVLDVESLSDEALVDVILDSLELQFLESNVHVEIRGPSVVMSTKSASITFEIARDASDVVVVVGKLTRETRQPSAGAVYASATASPSVEAASTTIQTGDC